MEIEADKDVEAWCGWRKGWFGNRCEGLRRP
jgi:hypothetical protein